MGFSKRKGVLACGLMFSTKEVICRRGAVCLFGATGLTFKEVNGTSLIKQRAKFMTWCKFMSLRPFEEGQAYT